MKRETLEKNNVLSCPVCSADMSFDGTGKSFVCSGEKKKHLFDIASSGYVNLLSGAKSSATSGDSKEMVRARSAFLESGYYSPFADAVADAARKYGARDMVDAGCGEGYYTNRLAALDGARTFGFDISKYAVEHAAKSAKRQGVADNTFYAAASIFDLPLKGDSVDTVVNLFAPCAETEFFRVLCHGGRLICGAAGREHLMELKRAVYDRAYENEGRADLQESFELIERINVKYVFCVDNNADLQNLFAMTPYYFRTSQRDREKLDRLDRLDITADFDILVFEKGQRE